MRLYGGALAVAEVEGLAGAGVGGASLRWLVSDHLGTPRMTADVTGNLAGMTRHDYLPFGEELKDGVGGRTTGQGYSQSDGTRQKFTGKERDDETGLDYFEARYFSNVQGRFTSSDPVMLTKTHFVNPQRWNLYVYVNNNPLALVDPDGRDPQGKGGGKVIDIFIAFPKNHIPKGSPRADFNKLKTAAKSAGYEVNIFNIDENEVKTKDVRNSLKNSALTIIIGHGSTDRDGPFVTKWIELNDGDITNMPPSDVGMKPSIPFPGAQSSPPETNADVGLFTCNSTQMGGAFNVTGEGVSIAANNGGTDGLTALNTMERAAAQFAKTYAQTGGDVEKAVKAAN